MQKTAYFSSEKEAQAACKTLKKSGVNGFKLIHNYSEDTLRYVSDNNPATLYLGSGTVKIPEVGLISKANTTPDALVGLDSYSSFVPHSGRPKGVMLTVESSQQAESIILSHGGKILSF